MKSEKDRDTEKAIAAEQLNSELSKLRNTLDSSLEEVSQLIGEAEKTKKKEGGISGLFQRMLNQKEESPSFGARINKLVGRLDDLKESLEGDVKHSERLYRKLDEETGLLGSEKVRLEKEAEDKRVIFKRAFEAHSRFEGKQQFTPDEFKEKFGLQKQLEKAKEEYEVTLGSLEAVSRAIEINGYYGQIFGVMVNDTHGMVANVSDALAKVDLILSAVMGVTKFVEINKEALERKIQTGEEARLELLASDCTKFIKTPLHSLEHLYKVAERRVSSLEYAREDLDLFLKNLIIVQKQNPVFFAERGGVYISALINKIAKPGDKFFVQTKTEPLFGVSPERLGCLLKDIELTVQGDAGALLGERAKNCKIIVEGRAATLVGHKAENTIIYLKGCGSISQDLGKGTNVYIEKPEPPKPRESTS